jgi:hypothetical protein
VPKSPEKRLPISCPNRLKSGFLSVAGTKGIEEVVRTLPRLMLHVYKLILPDPNNPEQPIRVTASLPADFKETLKALKLK